MFYALYNNVPLKDVAPRLSKVMPVPKSPFAASSSSPGRGNVEATVFPPGKQVLTNFTYQYPLKLIAPDSHVAHDDIEVTVVFLLNYGGGLVGGDKIDLSVTLTTNSRLVLLTQGSTKIFKSPTKDVVSRQCLVVRVDPGASLCYLPDPTQPFAESVYEQRQTFYIPPDGRSSLCVLDWVNEGRKARGESWSLWGWKGRNEVRELVAGPPDSGRLLLRDSLILLHEEGAVNGLMDKTNEMGVFGTLILHGPLFAKLGDFFIAAFTSQPRIGAKKWSSEDSKSESDQEWSRMPAQEKDAGLLWSAARVRGFVLIKFGADDLDGARRWLRTMIIREGSVEREFGHQALFCLR